MTLGVPLLVVLAGRPGTGKTTPGRRLAGALQAAYLRIDAIETAVAEWSAAPLSQNPQLTALKVAATR